MIGVSGRFPPAQDRTCAPFRQPWSLVRVVAKVRYCLAAQAGERAGLLGAAVAVDVCI